MEGSPALSPLAVLAIGAAPSRVAGVRLAVAPVSGTVVASPPKLHVEPRLGVVACLVEERWPRSPVPRSWWSGLRGFGGEPAGADRVCGALAGLARRPPRIPECARSRAGGARRLCRTREPARRRRSPRWIRGDGYDTAVPEWPSSRASGGHVARAPVVGDGAILQRHDHEDIYAKYLRYVKFRDRIPLLGALSRRRAAR